MAVQTYPAGARSAPRRTGWTLGMVALVVALALGGCSAGARNGGAANPSTGQTTTTTSASNNAALQQLQTDAQQYQLDQQQISSAANDANTDYSNQDNPLQP